MTLRHWQMEKVSGSAEPLLSTTGNKGLNRSSGSTINFDSTALFGKFSVESKHFFDTDAAGSLSDNEFTAAFWFYVPTGADARYIFQLGLHNTDVSVNGHTCVGLLYSYYSNKIFFTTGYKNASGGLVELGSLSRNVWHHCYISRTNSGTNSTLQVKITATDGTVVHDNSQVYTKADFSIDESGTGQYSYFNGHPAGGSLTLSNGKIEDFILKNGSVLSYASIYNSSAEVFQSDEPQVSVSTGAGSATLSDSNFTGTKTYSFYDTDATTLLQSGASNSYTSYASSSVAYTALVTDDNNNRVISTFFISQGGNDMPEIISGSKGSAAEALANGLQVNAQILGGMVIDTNGRFEALPSYAAAAAVPPAQSAFALSRSFSGSNTSVIHALNHLALQVDAANELSELDDVNFSGLADHDAFQYDSASSKWVNADQPEFDLTNATSLPISSGVSGLAAGVATFLGTPNSANLRGAVTDETGTGDLVFSTSPTLVTPNIGTPSAGTLTSCTGLPIATGLATGTSANLASVISDETGTGALVFANSPTLVTPALGTPSAAVLTNATGLPIASGLAVGTSANLASVISDETGTGALVFANSPTLVTPALGTPSSGVLTSCTGLPVSSGLVAGTFGAGTYSFNGSTISDLGTVSTATSITSNAFAGPLDGVVGGNSPAAGTFTSLVAQGNVQLGNEASDTIGVQGAMTVAGADATFGIAGSSTLVIHGKDASNGNQTYKIEVVGGILKATEQ